MKYKQKAIQLNKAKLQVHPLLGKLIKNDVVQLKPNKSIDELPLEVIQTLLGFHSLPVTFTCDGNCYLPLDPSGVLQRVKVHPLKQSEVKNYHLRCIEHLLTSALTLSC